MPGPSPDDIVIRVKHGGTKLELQLRAGEDPYAAAAARFSLPRGTSMKLISRGKLLPADSAATDGELYQLLATAPGEKAAPPGALARAVDVLVEYYAVLPAPPSWAEFSIHALVLWAYDLAWRTVAVVGRFFATAVVAPKPLEPREGPR